MSEQASSVSKNTQKDSLLLTRIPPEILQHMLSFLNLKDLMSFSECARYPYQLSSYQGFWKPAFSFAQRNLLIKPTNKGEAAWLYINFRQETSTFRDFAYCIGFCIHMERQIFSIEDRTERTHYALELHQKLALPLRVTEKLNKRIREGITSYLSYAIREYLLSFDEDASEKIKKLSDSIKKISSPEMDTFISKCSIESLQFVFDILDPDSEKKVKDSSYRSNSSLNELSQSFNLCCTYLNAVDSPCITFKAIKLLTNTDNKNKELSALLYGIFTQADISTVSPLLKYNLIDINKALTVTLYFRMGLDVIVNGLISEYQLTPLGVALNNVLLHYPLLNNLPGRNNDEIDIVFSEYSRLIDILIENGATNNVPFQSYWGGDEISDFIRSNSDLGEQQFTLKDVALFFKDYLQPDVGNLNDKFSSIIDKIIAADPVNRLMPPAASVASIGNSK